MHKESNAFLLTTQMPWGPERLRTGPKEGQRVENVPKLFSRNFIMAERETGKTRNGKMFHRVRYKEGFCFGAGNNVPIAPGSIAKV